MQLTCPATDRLREFLDGSVDDAEVNQISGHVVECPSCDRVLTSLESEQNDVLKTLREGGRTESFLQEPEFEQLRNTARFRQADTAASSEVDEHLETGKRLRDYRLVKKIGEGGMGTVYQAFHVHLAKHVALKILPSDKLRSKQSVARFRQEMRAVGKVNHSNVVSASDAGTIDGQHFLVMELVQGADLARIIHDRGPLCVADACEIVRQAAIGLQHAHDNGLVHRDVKPSNIMLALDGSVKLLDLGLAGLNNTEFESTANVVVTDRLTSVGQIMGTLDYMAPEQITASPQVDGKADIYALGATLFQLLTGRTPCGDRSDGTPERIEAVLNNPPLDIAALRDDVPEELCSLLLRMLAKNPEDRPQTSIDVAAKLKRFASDAHLVALAEACRTSLDMPSADVDVTDDVSFVVSRNTQPQDDGNSRRPFTAVALASFFLALFAAAVYFIVTNNGIVTIEVFDDSFKVAIDDQNVTVKDGKSDPIKLRAADHTLHVWVGETELITENFEISRNGKTAFKVELKKGKVLVSKDGEDFDRKAIALGNEAEAPIPNIADHERDADQRWKAAIFDEGKQLSGSKEALLDIKQANKHLVHIQELDCPLPASWQYRIYIPREKSAPLFRLVTGVCEDSAFADDKLSVKASVPVPLAREQFVLNITIRRASDGEYKCYAYIVGPKNADFHEIALPAVENLKLLTDPREKYFETGKRVVASGTRHQEVKLYQPGAAIPLVLLKTDEKSAGEDSAKAAESFPAIWLRLKMPAAPKDLSTAIHGDQQNTLPESPETDYSSVVIYWEPDGPQRIVATAQEKIESRKLIESARQLVKDGNLEAATDAYLKVLSLDPSCGRSSVVELFQEANRLVELGECIDETGLKRSIYEESLSRSTIKALLSDTKTRDLGLRVLRNYFRIYHRGRYSVLTSSEDFGIVWKDVPDLIYFLRVLLIPTDFEKEGAGWGRYSVLRVGDREEGSGPLSNASVLFCDKDVLRTFKNEVHALTKENPGWKGGLVLLASLEAELGNFDQSLAIINEHFIGTTAPVIPVSTAWVLGLALDGKSQDLDQIVIRLYEYSMRKIMLNFDEFRGIDPLRFSPLNELARLYAKYGRKKEARQLLYGLVDASGQHPLVQGYTPSVFNNCNYGPSLSCADCHRTEMNLPDYLMMSDVMTDIGYPVDSLISLARIDASFGNAFTSSEGWVEQKSLLRLTKEAKTPAERYRRYSLPLQKRRAEQAVTPRSVIDALELGTFETKHRYSQKTYDRIRSRRDLRDVLDFLVWSRTLKPEEKPSDAIDLMLSVRGEGPDAEATVFSPVIDILKLAAEFEGPNAAKEIADLDARLRLLSEVDSNDVQAAVASTVFAFLREDLETAENRLEVLKDLKLSSKNNAQRANATLWLAARYALQYEKTRAVGAILTERAIAAANALRGTRLKEAILRERSRSGLSTILELRPDAREKLARKAEELGNKWLAERLRSDPKEDDGEDILALANRLAKEEQWDSGCDAFLEAFRSDPNLFGAYVDGWFLTRKQIDCFEKAGRLADLARFFDVATLQRRRTYSTYGMDDLVVRLIEDRSPETRSAGYELLSRVFQYRERPAERLLDKDHKPFWKSVPNPVFLLRCWLIPKDIEKPGWVPFAISINDDTGSYSNRATEARPLLSDPGTLGQFADEVRELLTKHPTWIDGWALLALVEGEIGNYSEAAQLVRSRILTEDPATISASSLWTLGDFLNGKDQELNGVAVSLWELAVRKFAAEPSRNTLRVSPINTLARAYAEDNHGREARQLLFGLVDPINQHPLVKGYVRPPIGTSVGQKSSCNRGNQCITCHRNDGDTIRETEFGGFYDVIKMSEAMTDIGYPVDTLVELARTDACFRNAFSSSDGWVDASSEKGKYFAEFFSRRSSFVSKYDEQISKARAAVTPRKVIEALETDTFYRSSLRDEASVAEALGLIWNATGGDEKTKALRELARASQQQENKKRAPIDLMLSVRGEGPDAQATVFSPVIDILKLAVESKGPNAAKDIAQLDKRLVELSGQHSKDIEAGIAASVFAFLRDDVDAAEKRLEELLAMRSAGPTEPQASDLGLWLVAQYALADDRTKAMGEQLAERAIAAAEKQSDPHWKNAIHGDHLKSQTADAELLRRANNDKNRIRMTLERSPQLRDKLAQEAEELGNSELAEWIRSDLPADEDKDGKDAFAKAARLAEDEDWNAACDAFLEAFRANSDLFGAYVDGKFLTRTQIGCFEKAGRLTDLARFFNVTTLQRRRAFQSYGMNDLVIRLTEDRSPETRSAGYELLERVFQYRESVADSLLRGYSYERFWKSVPDPVFLLRCWLIPKDLEKRGWAPFNPAAIHEDEGSFSNRLTRARPLLVDPKAMRPFADELREQLQAHPKWKGGWALLAVIEGEIGNYSEAAQLVREHILTGDPATIPTPVFWTLGDFLYGKDPELNGIAVKLWELTVRKYATNPEAGTLRVSPINNLAKAYAEDNRDQEARQLLYGLVDPINQHPLVKGYAGNKLRCNLGTPSQCITCHRNDEGTIEEIEFGGFYDVIKMSEAMTDIGYPIDALMELARTDATFRNAFSSSGGWVDTSSEKGKYFEGRLSNRKFSIGFEYDEQTSKARSAVTPRKVIEALETDTFYRSSLRDEAIVSEALSLIRNAAGVDEKNKTLRKLARTSQERENKGSFALDLMLSVRGEGPDAQATVFSPVIGIFNLAAESEEPDAAKDIAELDKRLVTLSEQHPKSIETRIAATVFAFLRKDLDSAKDRLKQLQSITNYPESDGAAFWLVARHALQHDQTRLLGAVFSERALTAAEAQPDSRLKEAILRERTSIRSK